MRSDFSGSGEKPLEGAPEGALRVGKERSELFTDRAVELFEEFVELQRLGLDKNSPAFEAWSKSFATLSEEKRVQFEQLLAVREDVQSSIALTHREMDWREDIPRFVGRLCELWRRIPLRHLGEPQ